MPNNAQNHQVLATLCYLDEHPVRAGFKGMFNFAFSQYDVRVYRIAKWFALMGMRQELNTLVRTLQGVDHDTVPLKFLELCYDAFGVLARSHEVPQWVLRRLTRDIHDFAGVNGLEKKIISIDYVRRFLKEETKDEGRASSPFEPASPNRRLVHNKIAYLADESPNQRFFVVGVKARQQLYPDSDRIHAQKVISKRIAYLLTTIVATGEALVPMAFMLSTASIITFPVVLGAAKVGACAFSVNFLLLRGGLYSLLRAIFTDGMMRDSRGHAISSIQQGVIKGLFGLAALGSFAMSALSVVSIGDMFTPMVGAGNAYTFALGIGSISFVAFTAAIYITVAGFVIDWKSTKDGLKDYFVNGFTKSADQNWDDYFGSAVRHALHTTVASVIMLGISLTIFGLYLDKAAVFLTTAGQVPMLANPVMAALAFAGISTGPTLAVATVALATCGMIGYNLFAFPKVISVSKVIIDTMWQIVFHPQASARVALKTAQNTYQECSDQPLRAAYKATFAFALSFFLTATAFNAYGQSQAVHGSPSAKGFVERVAGEQYGEQYSEVCIGKSSGSMNASACVGEFGLPAKVSQSVKNDVMRFFYNPKNEVMFDSRMGGYLNGDNEHIKLIPQSE